MEMSYLFFIPSLSAVTDLVDFAVERNAERDIYPAELAAVVDTDAVTRSSGAKHENRERSIRLWFVERDLIEGVILLSDNLVYYASAAGIIIVLAKRKPKVRCGNTALLNASRHVRKGGPRTASREVDVRSPAAAFLEGEFAVITGEQAKEADYNLSPSRRAGQSETVAQRPKSEIIAEMRHLDL